MAQQCAPQSVGVVLTGMGRDGAQGLLKLREKGGRTLAQDQATSLIWGMPKAAVEAGAAERALPIESIAREIVTALRR
jgi:two-component system chemotaxis response regulator CheB